MADDVTLPGTGAVVATDDVAGRQFQIVKLDLGADGASDPVSGALPVSASSLPLPTGAATSAAQTTGNNSLSSIDGKLPALVSGSIPVISQSAASIDYAPGYSVQDGGGGPLATDPSGNLATRAQVLTDEATFRCNFANSSLSVALPSNTTLTNGSTAVTWALAATTDLHAGDYIKLDADAESAWAQISSIDSLTSGTLVSAYTGTGGTGAASRALLKQFTGSGGSISVASGQLTLTAGTTTSARTGVARYVDYAPLIFRARLNVSARNSNQNFYAGMREDSTATTRWFARFNFDGTTNTTVKCETGRNPSGAPSASETQTTTITLPNGLTSATLAEYRIELMTETVRFYVNDVLMATHTTVIPQQHDEMLAVCEFLNATAPSTANAVVDYLTVKNHNKLEVSIFSNVDSIVAANAPMVDTGQYSVAGVITINTDLLIIDTAPYAAIVIQCTSMGTTGVVTPAFTSDGGTTYNGGQLIPIAGGAIATTFNAAGYWVIPVVGPRMRLRLTTATTAGTTTLRTFGMSAMIPIMPTTLTATGSGTFTVGGVAAHDAAISGSPVRIGARGLTSNYTTIATGDTADLITTLVGALIQKPYAIPETEFVGIDSITASTTATQIKALTASNKNYVTGLTLSTDTLGAAGEIQLRSTPVVSTTATIASNTLVMSATYNWKVGDLVYVTASTVTGLTAANYYYILTVSGANLTFSATRGGSTLAISGTGVNATLAKILFRCRLQTTALPIMNINFPNPVDGGTGLAIEMCTPASLTSGRVDFNVHGYVAP